MKSNSSARVFTLPVLTAAAALFAFTSLPALALIVPVAQDTCSNKSGKLTSAAGSATSLTVKNKQVALLEFNLALLNVVPAAIDPANIQSALLQLYFVKTSTDAVLTVQPVTGQWSETFKGAPEPLPTISPTVLVTIPASVLPATGKGFVSVDITAAVVAALQSGTNLNIAIETATPGATVELGSKNGPSIGYGAQIDIEAGLPSTPSTATTVVPGPPPGMVLIPAGQFIMGDSLDSEADATPTLTVTVSAFYMDANLVSLSQWNSVYYWAKNNGYTDLDAGGSDAAHNPVYNVDWYDCVKWCNARSEQAHLTPVYYTDSTMTTVYRTGNLANAYMNMAAGGYRLPTEAEWEKAARGGISGQRFPWGNTIDETLANYYGATGSYIYDLGPNFYNALDTKGTTNGSTTPVGTFSANGYGLYDMAGNVDEWCWDWYGTPYAGGSNPTGPASGSDRVLRGGYWKSIAKFVRCAFRDYFNPDDPDIVIGFRSVLSPSQP